MPFDLQELPLTFRMECPEGVSAAYSNTDSNEA